MVNANGYHNTRTADGWRLTHQLIAEEKLGRKLREDEMVKFVDGNRRNLDPSNIQVIKKNQVSARKKLARLEAQLEDIVAQLRDLHKELGSSDPRLKAFE